MVLSSTSVEITRGIEVSITFHIMSWDGVLVSTHKYDET
jgi:hypothetical protein